MSLQTDQGATRAREVACVEHPAGAQDVDQARHFEADPEVALLPASSSWRLTAPLRALGRSLGRR